MEDYIFDMEDQNSCPFPMFMFDMSFSGSDLVWTEVRS